MVLSNDVKTLLDETMTGLVEGDAAVLDAAATPEPAPEVKAWLDDLLGQVDTYRDGALILLGFGVANGAAVDVTRRVPGDRGVSQYTEKLLDGLNIRCRRDVFQTISKGSDRFTGRAREPWNNLLEWASAADFDSIRRAFYYMARGIAATARALPPMPPLDVSRLTFPAVAMLFDSLLATNSGGAYEQFIFASLLYALHEETGGARVDTKSLNASDASAGTAADVQVSTTAALEAYEVTANDWTTKIGQADAVRRHYELPRVHILAPGANVTAEEIAKALADAGLESADLSVLDVRHADRFLLSLLPRHARRAALNKLYEHLTQRQPKDELIGQYTQLIAELGLVAET